MELNTITINILITLFFTFSNIFPDIKKNVFGKNVWSIWTPRDNKN